MKYLEFVRTIDRRAVFIDPTRVQALSMAIGAVDHIYVYLDGGSVIEVKGLIREVRDRIEAACTENALIGDSDAGSL